MTVTLPDSATLYEAAQQAAAAHLHLVIDHNDGGTPKLTPILLPGMQKIAVLDKALLPKAA